VTTDEPSVATFGVSPSHGETLDAIETDDVLRADRTPETVTLFVVEDGTTTAGAMRSYAGHDGSEYAAPGAYGYVNTELVDLLGWRFGTPRNSFGTSRPTSAGTLSSVGPTFRTIRPTSPTATARRWFAHTAVALRTIPQPAAGSSDTGSRRWPRATRRWKVGTRRAKSPVCDRSRCDRRLRGSRRRGLVVLQHGLHRRVLGNVSSGKWANTTGSSFCDARGLPVPRPRQSRDTVFIAVHRICRR